MSVPTATIAFSFQALTSLYRVSHSARGYEAVAESHAGRMMPISLDKGALRSCRLSFTELALLAGSRQKRQPARRGTAGDRASRRTSGTRRFS